MCSVCWLISIFFSFFFFFCSDITNNILSGMCAKIMNLINVDKRDSLSHRLMTLITWLSPVDLIQLYYLSAHNVPAEEVIRWKLVIGGFTKFTLLHVVTSPFVMFIPCELRARIEAGTALASFPGSCVGGAQEPGNKARTAWIQTLIGPSIKSLLR